jgi:saxitoxin biosynthesis operon SxtJ-like protein
MMQWSDIQFNPSTKTLRQFSSLFLVIFGVLALVEFQFRQRPQLAMVYGTLAVVIGPLGLIRPRVMRPVWVVWSVVAFPIGWVVSTVFLAVLFYAIFTPFGIAFRLKGRDTLALRRTDARTYWKPRPAARDKRAYFRQS